MQNIFYYKVLITLCCYTGTLISPLQADVHTNLPKFSIKLEKKKCGSIKPPQGPTGPLGFQEVVPGIQRNVPVLLGSAPTGPSQGSRGVTGVMGATGATDSIGPVGPASNSLDHLYNSHPTGLTVSVNSPVTFNNTALIRGTAIPATLQVRGAGLVLNLGTNATISIVELSTF